jgi:hypothetical protein
LCAFILIFEMQQYLHVIENKLCPDTSQIVLSYALTLNDVYFFNKEWAKIDHVTNYAAGNGLLDLLQWAREHRRCWNEWTCAQAAEKGHLEVLQWARENGCPWDSRTCSYAASGGHLEILKWARENGCFWGEYTCLYAAKG